MPDKLLMNLRPGDVLNSRGRLAEIEKQRHQQMLLTLAIYKQLAERTVGWDSPDPTKRGGSDFSLAGWVNRILPVLCYRLHEDLRNSGIDFSPLGHLVGMSDNAWKNYLISGQLPRLREAPDALSCALDLLRLKRDSLGYATLPAKLTGTFSPVVSNRIERLQGLTHLFHNLGSTIAHLMTLPTPGLGDRYIVALKQDDCLEAGVGVLVLQNMRTGSLVSFQYSYTQLPQKASGLTAIGLDLRSQLSHFFSFGGERLPLEKCTPEVQILSQEAINGSLGAEYRVRGRNQLNSLLELKDPRQLMQLRSNLRGLVSIEQPFTVIQREFWYSTQHEARLDDPDSLCYKQRAAILQMLSQKAVAHLTENPTYLPGENDSSAPICYAKPFQFPVLARHNLNWAQAGYWLAEFERLRALPTETLRRWSRNPLLSYLYPMYFDERVLDVEKVGTSRRLSELERAFQDNQSIHISFKRLWEEQLSNFTLMPAEESAAINNALQDTLVLQTLSRFNHDEVYYYPEWLQHWGNLVRRTRLGGPEVESRIALNVDPINANFVSQEVSFGTDSNRLVTLNTTRRRRGRRALTHRFDNIGNLVWKSLLDTEFSSLKSRYQYLHNASHSALRLRYRISSLYQRRPI